jgi:hypothetical protein
MSLTERIQRAWQFIRPHFSWIPLTVIAGGAIALTQIPKAVPPVSQRWEVFKKHSLPYSHPIKEYKKWKFALDDKVMEYENGEPPGVIVKDNKEKRVFHTISYPRASPDKKRVALDVHENDKTRIVIVSKEGVEELPFQQADNAALLGWADSDTLRIGELDVYECNIKTGDISFITNTYEKQSDNWRHLAWGTAIGAGVLSLFLLPGIIYARRRLQKPDCLSDCLVGFPAGGGITAGALFASLLYTSVPEFPITEGFQEALNAASICGGAAIGMITHQLLALFHAANSPMIPNGLRYISSLFSSDKVKKAKGAEYIYDDTLKATVLHDMAMRDQQYEAALELEERRCAVSNEPLPFDFILNLDMLRHLKTPSAPSEYVEYVANLLRLGRKWKAHDVVEEMFSFDGKEWDEALVLSGLRLTDPSWLRSHWERLYERIKHDFSFEPTLSRNKVFRVKGKGLLQDTIMFEEMDDDTKYANTCLVYFCYGSKYDVAKPVVRTNEGVNVYQITNVKPCGVGFALSALREFHNRVRSLSSYVEPWSYRDAFESFCLPGFPEERKGVLSNAVAPLIDSLERLPVTVVHGDYTLNNCGKCADREGVCIWDFENLCVAPVSLDIARLHMHLSTKEGLPNSEPALLNCVFDGMKLMSSSLRRGKKEDAKLYAERMYKAAAELNQYKGLASICHEAAFPLIG